MKKVLALFILLVSTGIQAGKYTFNNTTKQYIAIEIERLGKRALEQIIDPGQSYVYDSVADCLPQTIKYYVSATKIDPTKLYLLRSNKAETSRAFKLCENSEFDLIYNEQKKTVEFSKK